MKTETEIELARNVIRIERDALEKLEAGIDETIIRAADLVMATDRYVIVAGVGKSGHIGQKIAASLASTGTPSFFLHPTEASHADLGMIVPGSVLLAISYSGESREMVDLLRYCRSNAIPVIGMTRAPDSTLGRLSDVVLHMPTVAEACPNGLAPTSSTTMALALGDALTILLMDRRGFSREDFGSRHPGGKLGRSLQTAGDYVADRPDDIPSVSIDASVQEVILAVSEGRKGCVAVLGPDSRIVGMVTDGDLRLCHDTWPAHNRAKRAARNRHQAAQRQPHLERLCRRGRTPHRHYRYEGPPCRGLCLELLPQPKTAAPSGTAVCQV